MQEMSGNFPPAGRTPGRHRRPRARVIFVLNANQFVVTLTPSNLERRRLDERVARPFLSAPALLPHSIHRHHTYLLYLSVFFFPPFFQDCWSATLFRTSPQTTTASWSASASVWSLLSFSQTVKYNEYNLDLNNLRPWVCKRQAVQRKNSGALKTRASNARENSKVIWISPG